MLLRHITRCRTSKPKDDEEETHQKRSAFVRQVTLLTQADRAKSKFLEKYGSEYGYNGHIDELYVKEIQPRLGPDEHYLDYTGSGLYFNSQIQRLTEELGSTAYGNPHSVTPSSTRATHAVEQVREDLLKFFGADPNEYELVFTRSATGALQLIGEMFPFSKDSHYVYLQGNHKSVLGIREYAKREGPATYTCMSEGEAEAWVYTPETQVPGHELVPPARRGSQKALAGPTYSLFAYPAYDNFNGIMNPVDWVKAVRAKSTDSHKWKVLLDTAAFAPTHKIDLSEIGADFICISFYKLFGHPTGVGALVIRKDTAALMRKVYWGGSSAEKTLGSVDWIELSEGPEKFEDGTLPFLDIIELRHALRIMKDLGGIEAIERHTAALGRYLYEQASRLCHSNGAPMLDIYGHHTHPDSAKRQGATLSFTIMDPDGEHFSWFQAARDMADAGLHVRSGCACNPGQYCASLDVSEPEVFQLAMQKSKAGVPFPWEWIVVKRGGQLRRKPLGALRASLGFMSRFEDVAALLYFLNMTYKDRESDAETTPDDVVIMTNDAMAAYESMRSPPASVTLRSGGHSKIWRAMQGCFAGGSTA